MIFIYLIYQQLLCMINLPYPEYIKHKIEEQLVLFHIVHFLHPTQPQFRQKKDSPTILRHSRARSVLKAICLQIA